MPSHQAKEVINPHTFNRVSQDYIEDYHRRFMVVIGINSYKDIGGGRSWLSSLKTPIADACRIFRLLKDQFEFEGRLLAEREEVLRYEMNTGLSSSDSLEPFIEGNGTRGDILQALWDIGRNARPEDLFLFYYGGHSTVESGGMSFLLPYGTIRDRSDTYLMYPTLFGAFEEIPSLHKLLFFDCCFSGVITRDIGTVQSSEIRDLLVKLEPAVAAFASTDATNVAPDQFHHWSDTSGRTSPNSPFADALAEAFENLQGGENLIPAQIHTAVFDGVRSRVPTVPTKDGKNVPLQPVAKIVGAAPIILSKKGLRINCPEEIVLESQEKKKISIGVTGVDAGHSVTLQLQNAVSGVQLDKGELIIDGAQLPDDESVLIIQAKTKETIETSKKVRILLSAKGKEPLVFNTKELPPCFVETDYRIIIEVSGGVVPFKIESDGLPLGLEISTSGEIYGRVGKGEATGGGCLKEVVINLEDSIGQKLRDRFLLPVIDPKVYVRVPGGEFKFGYGPSPQRTQLLKNLKSPGHVVKDLACKHPEGSSNIPFFFIRRYPITNREWKDFINAENYPGIPKRWESDEDPDFLTREGKKPVTGLTGKDVDAFCDWRNTRLPGRFQWEKAARGQDGRLFPWGDEFEPHYCNCPEQHGCIYGADMVKSHSELFITRVDQHPHGAGPCGVEDMVGNTWELTRYILPEGGGRPQLARMGGSAAEGGMNLTTCFINRMENAVDGRLEGGNHRVGVAHRVLPPLTGFRDVIEPVPAPPYRQGFVRLDKADLKLEWSSDIHLPYDAYIARYQVSNDEYSEFIRDKGRSLPCHWSEHDEWFFPYHLRYHPVVNVTYEDVIAFCQWKSSKFGIRCHPLTESIWRLAVHQTHPGSGGRPRKYPWGNDYSIGLCNHPSAGYGETLPVFALQGGRSLCGALNLMGNAAEWVSKGKTAGGSWLHGVQSPGNFIVSGAEAGPDVGFRYFTYDAPDHHDQHSNY